MKYRTGSSGRPENTTVFRRPACLPGFFNGKSASTLVVGFSPHPPFDLHGENTPAANEVRTPSETHRLPISRIADVAANGREADPGEDTAQTVEQDSASNFTRANVSSAKYAVPEASDLTLVTAICSVTDLKPELTSRKQTALGQISGFYDPSRGQKPSPSKIS